MHYTLLIYIYIFSGAGGGGGTYLHFDEAKSCWSLTDLEHIYRTP